MSSWVSIFKHLRNTIRPKPKSTVQPIFKEKWTMKRCQVKYWVLHYITFMSLLTQSIFTIGIRPRTKRKDWIESMNRNRMDLGTCESPGPYRIWYKWHHNHKIDLFFKEREWKSKGNKTSETDNSIIIV